MPRRQSDALPIESEFSQEPKPYPPRRIRRATRRRAGGIGSTGIGAVRADVAVAGRSAPAHQDGGEVRGVLSVGAASVGAEPADRAAQSGFAGAQLDLRTLDRLRPLLDRLQRLAERGDDTETALGADLMAFALEGWAVQGVRQESGPGRAAQGDVGALGQAAARGGLADVIDDGACPIASGTSGSDRRFDAEPNSAQAVARAGR